MRLPPLSAQSVAKALEWSGYGPALAVSKMELKVRISKKELPGGVMDFDLELLPDGSLKGFPPRWIYQNELNPLVRAVLTIVSEIFIGFGDGEFYTAQLDEDFGTKKYLAQSTYLWMLTSPSSKVRERLVLNELLYKGVPVWVQLNTTDYDSIVYKEFYDHIGAMVDDFCDHGEVPKGPRPRKTGSGNIGIKSGGEV